MALRTITAPSCGLITLEDAKEHLRVDFTDDDRLISALILSASNLVEANVQRRYLAQTVEWVRDHWDGKMVLPIAPGVSSSNISITGITYVDLTSTTQTLDPSLYWVRPTSDTQAVVRRWYAVWPLLGDGAERVVIRFVITGDITTVPPLAQHATRMLVSHLYQNRDAVVGVDNRDSSAEIPFGVEQLLSPERWNAQW